MADKVPPYADIHPLRVIFLIPQKPSATLANPEKWSKEFNAFIARCLNKNVDARPSAEELLKV